MALPAHIARDLRSALRSFRAKNSPMTVPTSAGRALEAWLMMSLARAAQRSGRWSVTLRQGDGSQLPLGATFNFPTYQSGILPSNPTGPSFVQLDRAVPGVDTLALELHGSLQWKGRSGATHEIDVSLLPQSIAQPLRAHGGHPRGLPIAGYECKDKIGAASTDEMRETIARLFDLALVTRPYPGWDCRMFAATSPHVRWGRRQSIYRAFFATGAYGVVRAGGFSRGARNLGRHYHVRRHEGIYGPGAIAAVEARFLQVLDDVDNI